MTLQYIVLAPVTTATKHKLPRQSGSYTICKSLMLCLCVTLMQASPYSLPDWDRAAAIVIPLGGCRSPSHPFNIRYDNSEKEQKLEKQYSAVLTSQSKYTNHHHD